MSPSRPTLPRRRTSCPCLRGRPSRSFTSSWTAGGWSGRSSRARLRTQGTEEPDAPALRGSVSWSTPRSPPPPCAPRPSPAPPGLRTAVLQEGGRHRLLPVHVPAEGGARRGTSSAPDQGPRGAAPPVSGGPQSWVGGRPGSWGWGSGADMGRGAARAAVTPCPAGLGRPSATRTASTSARESASARTPIAVTACASCSSGAAWRGLARRVSAAGAGPGLGLWAGQKAQGAESEGEDDLKAGPEASGGRGLGGGRRQSGGATRQDQRAEGAVLVRGQDQD